MLEKMIIKGGQKLKGTITASGSKNAALPILAATLLVNGECTISNIPGIRDVDTMNDTLDFLGSRSAIRNGYITIDNSQLRTFEVPEYFMRQMRASVFLLGPLLGRQKRARISYPGGCAIGSRPIDLHLKGLESLGVKVKEKGGFIDTEVDELKGAEIHLDFPSVGATENLMMAAVISKGNTILHNAAREPEIVDLQNFLNKAGAKIRGAGTSTIKVTGVDELRPCDYNIIPDRIEIGTYMVACAITGGDIEIKNVIPEHIEPQIAKLEETGIKFDDTCDSIKISTPKRIKATDFKTLPYPGFPTDLQSPMMALMTVAEGTSIVTENIFENRLKHVDELRRMGADITISGNTAVVRGVDRLSGASVEATDLRAGAALVVAGLAADGITEVSELHYIDRGYESLEKKLTALNAKVARRKFVRSRAII